MGLKVILPNANFSKYIDILEYPNKDALSGLFYLGGDAAQSLVNHADDSVATANGAIVYSANSARFSGEPYACNIDTGLVDTTNDVTVVYVFKYPVVVTSGRMVLSNYEGTYAGNLIVNSGMLQVDDGVSVYDSQTRNTIPKTVSEEFGFAAFTISGNVAKAYQSNYDRLVEIDSTTLPFTRALSGDKQLAIGGSKYASTAYKESLDLAFVSYHKKALTFDELKMIYEYMKSYSGKKGFAIS